MDLDLRASLRRDIEAVGGRHDDPRLYGGPAGDPGLTGGPESLSWEINGDFASIGIAGTAAILMELVHPSVMAGVSQHSAYRTNPLERARNTLGFVLGSTFGNTEAATALIGRVRRAHTRIEGTRPDGVPYRALDPELLTWVHTSIPWAIMTAFDRYCRPLSPEDKDRYLGEQAPIGRMMGAEWVPETVAELEAYVREMRPKLAMTEHVHEFLSFVVGDIGGERAATPAQQLDRRLGVSASMTLMPKWARHLTGTYQPTPIRMLHLEPRLQLQTRMTRWAIPQLPCKQLAEARFAAADLVDAAA